MLASSSKEPRASAFFRCTKCTKIVAHALLRAASPLLATLCAPYANKQLTPNWLRSVKKQLTVSHQVAYFFRAQSAQKSVPNWLRSVKKQLTMSHPLAHFFPCTKCTKARGARTPACRVATPGDALTPYANKQLTPKLASFRQKTTHRVPPARLFFPVHKVHKSAWRTHSCVPRRHSWRRFDPVCKQTTYPKIGFVSSKNNSPCPTRSPIFSRAQSAQCALASNPRPLPPPSIVPQSTHAPSVQASPPPSPRP